MTTNTSSPSKFSVLRRRKRRSCPSTIRALRLLGFIATISCITAFRPPTNTPHHHHHHHPTSPLFWSQSATIVQQQQKQQQQTRSVKTKCITSCRPTSSSSCLFHSVNNDDVAAAASSATPSWTQQDVMDFASSQGLNLTFSTLGPGYRVVARALHDPELILGYCEGFVRPPPQRILHLDKMEVFRKKVQQASRESGGQFQVRSGSSFGMGLLLGLVCALHGQSQNCRDAEFLAIDDRPEQHRKLVQYYKRSGFDIIKYVGDDIGDIPDRLVWGGCGTLMRQDIDVLVQSWSETLTKSRAALQERNKK